MKIQTIILLTIFLFGVGGPGCNAYADVYKYEQEGKTYYSNSIPADFDSLVVFKTPSYAKSKLLYPKSYYPQPEPKHFPSTGAVCWKTLEGNWRCAAGRAANKIEVNVSTAGFPIAPGFGHHNFKHMKSHKR